SSRSSLVTTAMRRRRHTSHARACTSFRRATVYCSRLATPIAVWMSPGSPKLARTEIHGPALLLAVLWARTDRDPCSGARTIRGNRLSPDHENSYSVRLEIVDTLER